MRSLLALFVAAVPAFASAQGVSVTFPNPLARPHMSYTMNSQSAPIVIRADRIVDGRGNVIQGGDVVVENGKIVRIDKTASGTPTYDLRGFTLLPGLIDAHAHLSWYFNRQGRYHTRADGDTPVESMLSMAANAYATLMAGFTTIQSPGRSGGQGSPRMDRERRRARPARAHVAVDPFNNTRLGAGLASRARAPAQGAGRRRHQDLRVGEHSRRWRADDERRAARRALRGGEGSGHAHDGPRAQLREHKGVGERGLQSDRAWRVRQRRSAQADGRQGRLLRPTGLPRLPQLSRQPRQVRRDRQLQRGRLRGDGEGAADGGRDVQARDPHAGTQGHLRDRRGRRARTGGTPKSSCAA